MSNFIVAIDGPAASGKSTVSRKVAESLQCIYVDSGSLYRGVTWQLIRQGVSTQDPAAVIRVLKALPMDFFIEAGAVRFRIDGLDPGSALRSEAVQDQVSAVAAIPEVRHELVQQLRSMTRFGNLVMEGRDIGTVVFPETPFKFYLDADPEERARRRLRDMQNLSIQTVLRQVKTALQRRDAADSVRREAPLRIASGAKVIETTRLSIEEVVAVILECIHAQPDRELETS